METQKPKIKWRKLNTIKNKRVEASKGRLIALLGLTHHMMNDSLRDGEIFYDDAQFLHSELASIVHDLHGITEDDKYWGVE